MYFRNLSLLLLVTIILFSCDMKKTVNTETVKDFELNRYLGKWYEIARFPNRFEKELVGVTATYSLRDDGKIEVLNEGRKNSLDGELKQAKGKAKVPDASNTAALKVAFFLFFYADYYVMELDKENYQWALVGSSTDKYLWILSRTPQMDENIYNQLVESAKSRGYDVSKLYKVPQKNN